MRSTESVFQICLGILVSLHRFVIITDRATNGSMGECIEVFSLMIMPVLIGLTLVKSFQRLLTSHLGTLPSFESGLATPSFLLLC